ncbi:MAG: hypothetical protein IPK83_11095 [Planctomycetes bacterium]|nr:hypothetical protein [Planctomycetota bacterium]
MNPQALTFRIERCTFEGGELAAVSNVYVADTSFVGGSARVSGYVYLDNVTTNGIPLEFEKDAGAQSALIDHVSVTNSNSTAGLKLSGANYHIGPDTLIQGNLYPVEFTVLAAGLTPDSVLPATGNTANEILAHAFDGGNQITWPDLGLPYIVDRNVESAGSLTVLPGVNIHFEQTGGAIFNGLPVRMSGTFAKPIVLEPVNSNLGWVGIEFFQVATQLVQNVRLSGAQFGVGSDESLVSVIDSVFKDNNVAGTANTFGTWTARNCQFFDNAVGLQTGNTTNAGSFDASGTTMPNSFVGNDVGVQVNSPLASNTSTAAECWWGDASGPTHPNNPGGTGDYAGIQISRVVPFLFEAPTYSNPAPMVEMEPGPLFAHVGDRIIVRWSVVDDGPIVTQRIEYSQAAGGFPFVTLAELGPNERSWEYEVQSVPPTPVNSRAAVRVVTVDDAGNESWDVVSFWVPYQEDWTVPAIEVPAPTQLRPGDFYDVTWSPTATASVFLDVGSEGTLNLIPAGGHVGSGNNPKRMPYASTDLARIMVQFTYGAGGREEYYVSDYFTLRPDPQIADDAPPTVELISPTPGSVYPGGGTIPVAWTASDDDGLRNFDIQASYDGGVTWWSIARSISPTTTSFNWHLPPSIGITDVRVRVIARDVRFQTSSDGTTVAFGIAPGAGTVPGDIDGDGDLDFQDLELFAGVLVDADPIRFTNCARHQP